MDDEEEEEAIANAALGALASRSDIKLQGLDIFAPVMRMEDGLAKCLHGHPTLTSLELPQTSRGGAVDKALDTLSNLQLLHVFLPDVTGRDEREWLSRLPLRFTSLNNLGLALSSWGLGPFPLLPRELARLLSSRTLHHIALAFDPAITLDDGDVQAMGHAWPSLQTMTILNWGTEPSPFSTTVLSKLAKHLAPTLEALSISTSFKDLPDESVHPTVRFPALRRLHLSEATLDEIPPDSRLAVAAYLARLCPPGIRIYTNQDTRITEESNEKVWKDIVAMIRKEHLAKG